MRKHTIVYGGKEIVSGKIGNFSIDRHYYNNTLFADSSGGEYASAMLKIKFCPLCGKNLEE